MRVRHGEISRLSSFSNLISYEHKTAYLFLHFATVGFMGSPRREGLARLSCMSIAALRTLGAELLILERRRTLSSL